MATQTKKPIAAAVGAAFLASVTLAPLAQAAENPFHANSLSGGYNLAEKAMTEGKCGEGKCGESMKKAHEGNCGGEKAKTAAEGKCGGGKAAAKAEAEGKAAESDTKPAGSDVKP
ncbi:MAG: hypothetical protein HYX64_01120 [Gammaproteobacteria bacterium]|nr:hypothetical protein [Gammaproteobacteria bacterium]